MLTKKDKLPEEYQKLASFWGEPKGMFRHLEVSNNGSSAVYVIEEPPGYRVIRYNRRRYRVFVPYVYFFVKVRGNSSSGPGRPLYVFFAKKSVDLEDGELFHSFFPNQYRGGMVCMQQHRPYQKGTPLETALEVCWAFWASNGNEFHFDGDEDTLPEFATRGKSSLSTFRKWEKASPREVMTAKYRSFVRGGFLQALSGGNLTFES